MSNYLLVVGNDTALTAVDTWLQSRLTGQGHSVTVIDDGAAVPGAIETTYHAVIFSSTANINQLSTKYDSTTRGVISFFAYPHTKFTTQASPSNGAITSTQYVTAGAGDPVITSGAGTTVTYTTSNALHTYVDNSGGTSFGSGVALMLAARVDLQVRVTGARYDTGATMTSATTAPSRRLRFGFDDVTLLNATGQGWVDNGIAWVTTILANVAPTANAGPDQNVIAGTTVTLDGTASSDSDGTVAGYQWTQVSGTAVTLSSATASKPTFTSPSSLSGATLVFGLTVTDNQSATSTQDTVTITVYASAQVKVRVSGAWVVKPFKARKSGAWYG